MTTSTSRLTTAGYHSIIDTIKFLARKNNLTVDNGDRIGTFALRTVNGNSVRNGYPADVLAYLETC